MSKLVILKRLYKRENTSEPQKVWNLSCFGYAKKPYSNVLKTCEGEAVLGYMCKPQIIRKRGLGRFLGVGKSGAGSRGVGGGWVPTDKYYIQIGITHKSTLFLHIAVIIFVIIYRLAFSRGRPLILGYFAFPQRLILLGLQDSR